MTRRLGLRRTLLIAVALAAAGVPAPVSAGTPDGTHCIAPWGADLNEEWGISEAIVWAFCTEFGSGQDWRVAAGWGMNETFKKVPKDFVPAGDTPLEDFLAKFVGVKIVVDPGTTHERTYRFTDTSKLQVGGDDGIVGANLVTMGVLDPLSVGTHVVEAYWTMSAQHCDGGGRDVEVNCLPAGDSLGFATEITVSSGN